jgi:hypothetical protein
VTGATKQNASQLFASPAARAVFAVAAGFTLQSEQVGLGPTTVDSLPRLWQTLDPAAQAYEGSLYVTSNDAVLTVTKYETRLLMRLLHKIAPMATAFAPSLRQRSPAPNSLGGGGSGFTLYGGVGRIEVSAGNIDITAHARMVRPSVRRVAM